MSITAIILLILLGLLLFIIEFLVLPGLTVSGIGGLICFGIAIWGVFKYHGNTSGFIVLLLSFIFVLVAFYFVFKSGTWNKMTLSNNVEGKIKLIDDTDLINPGDQGKTVSRLSPMGKVMVHNKIHEAKSLGGYVDQNTKIEVIKIQNNTLIVKPLT